MFDWSKYRLKDRPFVVTPKIQIDAKDKRTNGKLFCKDVMKEEHERLLDLATSRTNVIYVSSDESVLGVGKSALMAYAYWKLKQRKEDVIWIEATGGISMSPTLGRIVDAMILEGHISKIKRAIDVTKSEAIKVALKNSIISPSPTLIRALKKILSMPDEDIAYKYANIRRSILIYSTTEVFRYLLALFEAVGVGYFYFFIDQFEEYIMAHSGKSGLRKLGDEVNDLLRNCAERACLVLSVHPNAETVLDSAAGSFITTFAPLKNSLIVVHRLTPEECKRITQYYLDEFREDSKGDPFPFEESVIRYLSYKASYNVRDLIKLLRNALIEGAKKGFPPIDNKFISNERNHFRVLGNVENEWKDFVNGKIKLVK